jgi:uncharacterized repeat protein (TIGR02543 family)
MKRNLFLTGVGSSLLFGLILAFGIGVVGCNPATGPGTDPGTTVENVTVTFNTNGGTAVEPDTVLLGELLRLPEQPSKEGKTFAGWFTDEALTAQFDKSAPITQNITLYAKWISGNSGNSRTEAIPLTPDQWTDGSIAGTGEAQWFQFTATAETQYLHFSSGTLYNADLYIFDGNTYTGDTSFSINPTDDYTPFTEDDYGVFIGLTVGKMYYVRVSVSLYGDGGSYRIAVSKNEYTFFTSLGEDAVTLTANAWADGAIPQSDGFQWFTFTADASPQYLHFLADTLTDINVALYDSNEFQIDDKINLYNNNEWGYFEELIIGEPYYILVTPYYVSDTGTYKIGFTDNESPPSL